MRKLLTEVDVIRVIKEHTDFLEKEFDIDSENGSIITDETFTMDMIFSTFYENVDCKLENDGSTFFITFDHGYVVRLKNLPGYYKNKRKTEFYPFYNDVITCWDEEA